jgi:hypothetical protein
MFACFKPDLYIYISCLCFSLNCYKAKHIFNKRQRKIKRFKAERGSFRQYLLCRMFNPNQSGSHNTAEQLLNVTISINNLNQLNLIVKHTHGNPNFTSYRSRALYACIISCLIVGIV